MKADIAGGLIEREWDAVHLDRLAQAAAGHGLRSRGEKGSGIGALVDAVEEGFEIAAGQEKTSAHLGGGRYAQHQRLGRAGLQFEEALDVFALVMGTRGVLHRATNFRQARKPSDRPGHLEFPLGTA
ncbi:MAG: hypothetical protein WCA20_29100 [Candidatus Sulfotelmatobacter sp.]